MTERIEIEMPDGTIIDAPAGVTQAQVMARYQKANQPQASAQPQGPKLGEWASAAVRPLVKAATGIPGIFADGTMAAWNLATGQRNQMPSEATNALLDKYTTAPQGVGKGAEFVSTAIAGAKIPMPKIGQSAPAGFMPGRDAIRNETLKAAQQQGYVVPPSSNNPTVKNRLLEGLAGKVKLNQEAVIKNQSATDRLAAMGIQQNADAPITTGALDEIRKEAFQKGYEPLRSVGTINAGEKYNKALDSIRAAAKGAERSFPGLTKGDPVESVVDSLRQKTFDSADAVDAIKILRQEADDAYRSGNGSLGRAYKSAAKALESAIETELENRGENGRGLLQAFRDARTLIAKTHTTEKGLVGDSGASNARAYAAELLKKPLSGEQKKIADFASQFGKFTPKPTGENFTPLGPADVYGSSLLAVGADSALPFAYPLTRMGLRQYLLSPQGQKTALRNPAAARQNLGLLGGVFPQVEQELVRQ